MLTAKVLAKLFGDVVGKIVGDAQVLAPKRTFPPSVSCRTILPPRTVTEVLTSTLVSDLALHLATLLELFHGSVQRNQIRNAGSRTITASKDLVECAAPRTRCTKTVILTNGQLALFRPGRVVHLCDACRIAAR